MLERLRRQLAFAAQVPPRQIVRRFWLVGRRRAERRLRPRLAVAGLRRSATAPLPLFAPRQGLVRRDRGVWTFCFVGREVSLGDRLDWRAPGPGAADELWRMNLHYMEYLEGLSDADAAELIAQWIDANPPYAPGAAADRWNAYTLSLRVVVWMQQLKARVLPDDLVAKAEASLAGQLRYLERHLETDLGGNHLVKNIKALLWGSAFFAGPAAERWRRRGLTLLRRELRRQMLGDGMHYELSPSYHAQVVADLLEVRHALGEDPLGGALDQVLHRAAQVIADLAHPDGLAAEFGDAGLTMAYAPGQCLDAHRRLFGSAPGPRPVFALPVAGYFGAREADAYLVVDAGQIAPATLPAHGHGDMFSFEWSVAGERLIVDQGVLEYITGEDRGAARSIAGKNRAASRSAAFHNTLSVDGMDQAEFYGAFRCGRRGRVRIIEHRETACGFILEAEHDGFRRLHAGPLHRRRFEASAGRIRIDDRLDGPTDRRTKSNLLLHPDVAVERLAADRLRLVRGSARAMVTGSLPLRLDPAVWWPDMGFERATRRVVMALPPGTDHAWLHLNAAADIA